MADGGIMAALVSGSITAFGIGIAYVQWRRDVRLRLNRFREEVTVELVRQRIGPYNDLMRRLEPMSVVHNASIRGNRSQVAPFLSVFQDAIYGMVGLLASHDTRRIIVYAREGCLQFANGKIDYEAWLGRVRAVHIALRSDLGIGQAGLMSEVERLHHEIDVAEPARMVQTWVDSRSSEYSDVLSNEHRATPDAQHVAPPDRPAGGG